MVEGTDYWIREVNNYKELSATILSGFAAGIIQLVGEGETVNVTTVRSQGMLMTCNTEPKPKPAPKKKKPAPKKKAATKN
ncbi:MAG: hypothetical protein GY799_21145 [Desulfobulbaceae bacterium]|nr:hypothetical protein [Desulfobulbaceae bacterium]